MLIRVVFSGAEIAADIYFLYYVILKCLHFSIISMCYYCNQKLKSKSRVERIKKKIFDYIKGETTYWYILNKNGNQSKFPSQENGEIDDGIII